MSIDKRCGLEQISRVGGVVKATTARLPLPLKLKLKLKLVA